MARRRQLHLRQAQLKTKVAQAIRDGGQLAQLGGDWGVLLEATIEAQVLKHIFLPRRPCRAAAQGSHVSH